MHQCTLCKKSASFILLYSAYSLARNRWDALPFYSRGLNRVSVFVTHVVVVRCCFLRKPCFVWCIVHVHRRRLLLWPGAYCQCVVLTTANELSFTACVSTSVTEASSSRLNLFVFQPDYVLCIVVMRDVVSKLFDLFLWPEPAQRSYNEVQRKNTKRWAKNENGLNRG